MLPCCRGIQALLTQVLVRPRWVHVPWETQAGEPSAVPPPLPSCTDPDGLCIPSYRPGLLLPSQMKVGTDKLSFDTESYW